MIDPADSRTRSLPVTVPCPTRINFASSSRLYSAVLDRDLFEQWTVLLSWGGRHNLRGGGKSIAVESFEQGMAFITALVSKREKRGYQRII